MLKFLKKIGEHYHLRISGTLFKSEVRALNTVAMDEKLSEQVKPKITRSRARHERRKRLLTARKAAGKDPQTVTIQTNVEADGSNDSKSPVNRSVTEGLSKSKARRLRKRNKTNESCDKSTENNSSSQNPECVNRTHTEDSCELTENQKIETKTTKSDIIELSSVSKKSDIPKLSVSEHELLENEKNLKITESSRPSRKSSLETIVTIEDPRGLIINKESPKTIERDTISESKARRDVARDEVSLTDKTKESPPKIASSESTSLTSKMISQEKTREQVKAEREAKKAAKAAAKAKPKIAKSEVAEKIVDAPSNTKKIVKETKIDVVEIVAITTQLTTTDSKKKPDVVSSSSEAKSEGGKSKSELRAERRAKQEAQRAAKQGQVAEKTKPKATSATKVAVETVKKTPISPGKVDDSSKKVIKRGAVPKEDAHEINLFKHLYHEREQALINMPTVNSRIHPAIVRLGVQYANKVIVGSNARCVALLAAVKQLIEDFERPSQADFTRGLEASLQESSAYLHHCRPLAVSMQNALRHLKWQMTQLPATTSDKEAKTKLGNAIETYIQEQIQLADKAISITIQTKISDSDVILTYGYSSLIHKILCDAHDAHKKFRVVVVDGRPWLEGRELLRRLAKHGLECSYVLINALSFIMPEVTKVFLGAHAILANGAVMSRVGTAQVALMAKAFNVPVLVACETHKTCERVQTDSIVYNEIADADELAQNLMGSSKRTTLMNWRAKKSLNLLNLTYDVTPADLVTAVVTELAILPCTSVPVILRIKPSEI